MARSRRSAKLSAPSAATIYLRVSTQGQADSGLGREAQEAACQAFCGRQGWPVLGVHVDDGLGGKLPIAERPGLAAAIAATRAAPGAVFVVYSLSRAFRTQRECWATVEDEHGNPSLPLVSATEQFDLASTFGRAAFGMLTTFARFEADLIADRTIAALDAARARGVKLGAPSMVERMVDGRRELNPDRVELVRRIRALHAGGMSFRKLAEHLNAMGIPTAKPGARWHMRTVRVAVQRAGEAA